MLLSLQGKAAAQALEALESAIGSTRRHGPAHPLAEKALTAAAEGLAAYTQEHGPLTAAIRRHAIVVGDEPVLGSESAQYSICSAAMHSAFPLGVSALGGATVAVSGENFGADQPCRIGDLSTRPMHVISSRVGKCEVPFAYKTKAGFFPLSIGNATMPLPMYLYEEPKLSLGNEQLRGSHLGGTDVHIHLSAGDSLLWDESLACRFGTIAPVSAVMAGDRKVKCVSPAHSVGEVHVSLAMNGHEYLEDSWPFSYVRRVQQY